MYYKVSLTPESDDSVGATKKDSESLPHHPKKTRVFVFSIVD